VEDSSEDGDTKPKKSGINRAKTGFVKHKPALSTESIESREAKPKKPRAMFARGWTQESEQGDLELEDSSPKKSGINRAKTGFVKQQKTASEDSLGVGVDAQEPQGKKKIQFDQDDEDEDMGPKKSGINRAKTGFVKHQKTTSEESLGSDAAKPKKPRGISFEKGWTQATEHADSPEEERPSTRAINRVKTGFVKATSATSEEEDKDTQESPAKRKIQFGQEDEDEDSAPKKSGINRAKTGFVKNAPALSTESIESENAKPKKPRAMFARGWTQESEQGDLELEEDAGPKKSGINRAKTGFVKQQKTASEESLGDDAQEPQGKKKIQFDQEDEDEDMGTKKSGINRAKTGFVKHQKTASE
jgi:hypothetical protein